MVLIAQVVGEASKLCGSEPLAGIELGIFAGDECRTSAITDEEGMVCITIPGDAPCKLTFRVADGPSAIVDVPSTIAYETDAVIGTPSAPLIIDLGNATGITSLDNSTISPIDNCYDLSGRKLSNSKWSNGQMRKGVYIINGQKKVR